MTVLTAFEQAMHPLDKEGMRCPRLHYKESCQQVKGGGCSCLPSAGEATAAVRVQWRTTKISNGLEHLLYRWDPGLLSLKRESSGEPYIHLTEGNEEDGSRIFSVVPGDRPGSNGHLMKLSEDKENLPYSEGGQILPQVVWGTQSMAGHHPRQPALPHPASGGLDYVILRGSF